MTSYAQGHLFIPCWNDDGTLKPIPDSEGMLPFVEQSPLENIQARMYGYIDGDWQKQPILLGYSDRWSERVTGTSTGGAATNAISTPVPANYVYILESWTIVHTDTAARSVFFTLSDGTVNAYLYVNSALTQNVSIYAQCQVTLKEDDVVQFTVWGLVTGKTAVIDVWGRIVKIG